MKQKIFAVLIFLCVIVAFSSNVVAQTNYANLKADELSDAQVRQLIQRAESIGYNDAQLEQMALAQGMKQEEVLKLRKRVEAIRKQDGGTSKAGNKNTGDAKTQNNSDRQYNGNQTDSLSKNQPTKQELIDGAFEDLQPKIFGSDLFKNGEITFEPNLRIATPAGYVIGPDDELLIDLSGDNEASNRLKVSPDGTIRIDYVGPIAVGGLTIERAISKIRAAMSGTYAGLKNGRTRLSVNLGNIRSIKVVLTGQVTKPGTYTLPSLASVFNALYASGGPSKNGSFRNIQVIRNNKLVSTIDVYDFILNGISKGNIRLQDQDVINIPAYSTRVEVVGEVKNPAIFESLPGEHFQDILKFASGFSTAAYKAKVKVFQNTDRERKITDIPAAEFNTYVPKNGDKFFVEPILDRFINRVEITGAVFRPGPYELDQGLTLSALIKKADGLKEDAFLNRGYINRLNADNTAILLPFDVSKIMSGATADIPLQREDKIVISSIFDLQDEYKVSITGEVRAPGTFGYAKGITLEDLIQMAGGFKEGATPNRIEISRRIKNSNISSEKASTAEVFIVNVDQKLHLQGAPFILAPFDIVSIRNAVGYQVQKQVFVEGEVLYPGPYTILNKNERISDLITRAGGLTPAAYMDGSSLKRPGAPTKNDKRAVDDTYDKEQSLITLQRTQRNEGIDSVNVKSIKEVPNSDLVGIDLSRILENPGSTIDLLLEEGDIVRVPKQLQTVKVSGEVLNPNNSVFLQNKSFKDYINSAGGFTAQALKRGAFIKYANGSAKGPSHFLFFRSFPKVTPGAEIFVPLKAEKERLNAQAWIGIGTGITSLAAILVSFLTK